MKARLPQGYQNSTPNMNQMVRKAQKMQEDIGKIQEELAVKEYTKQDGGPATSSSSPLPSSPRSLTPRISRCSRTSLSAALTRYSRKLTITAQQRWKR